MAKRQDPKCQGLYPSMDVRSNLWWLLRYKPWNLEQQIDHVWRPNKNQANRWFAGFRDNQNGSPMKEQEMLDLFYLGNPPTSSWTCFSQTNQSFPSPLRTHPRHWPPGVVFSTSSGVLEESFGQDRTNGTQRDTWRSLVSSPGEVLLVTWTYLIWDPRYVIEIGEC